MPQIILKERKAHLASYTLFTRDVDQYKDMSLSQLYQPPRALFSQNMYHQLLLSCEYCKFLRTAFFQTSKGSCLRMFFKIGVLKSSQESTHVGGSFQKNLQTQGLQLYITAKKASPQVFSCEVCEIFKNTFFIFFKEYLW